MRFFWQCALYICLATGSFAQTMTVTTLREAIADRDFAGVDAGLTAAQSAYLDGALDADDMRALFVALSRSDPKVAGFVADWLERDHDNPKAQIARAWSVYNAAGFVGRGNNAISRSVAQDMYEKAYDLAYQAYLSEPDLIPISDAMVRGFADNRVTTYFSHTALDAVLETRPNWGSVWRALHQTTHFSAGMTRQYCASIAADFGAENASKIEHRCLVTAVTSSGRKGLIPYVERTLWDDSDPTLTITRLQYFLTGFTFADATDEQIEWAKSVLLTYPANQFELVTLGYLAKSLETQMRSKHGYSQFFSRTFAKARMPLAEEYLRHDPYNLDLIDMVEGVAFMWDLEHNVMADGRNKFTGRPPDLPFDQKRARDLEERAQKKDFAERRLHASPYHAKFWQKYATFAQNRTTPRTLFDGDAALENAVIYSNDPAKVIKRMISGKQFQYMKYLQYDDFNQDQRDGLPDWQRFRREINLADQLLCPYLRARLLHDQLCAIYQSNTNQCSPPQDDQEPQSLELHERAMDAPECAGLLNADINDLWYTGTPFEEALVQDN